MTLLDFTKYYRQNGLRRIQSLAAPQLVALHELPRNAIYHYLSLDPEVQTIDPTCPFLGTYLRKKVAVYHPEELVVETGVAGRNKMQLRAATLKWFHDNRQFLFTPKYDTIRDPSQLIVFNYSYLTTLYRYTDNIHRARNEYVNSMSTMVSQMAEALNRTDRVQVLEWRLPATMMPFKRLETLAADEWSTLQRMAFGTVEHMNLYELWLWLNPETRHRSVLAQIDVKMFPRVELMLPATDGRHAVISLGYLNSWIMGQPNQTEFPSIRSLESRVVRKFVYNLYTVLALAKDAIIDEPVAEMVAETEIAEGEEAVPVDPVEAAAPEMVKAITVSDNLEAIEADLDRNIEDHDVDLAPAPDGEVEIVDNYNEVIAELQGQVTTNDLLRRRLDEYATARNIPATQYKQLLNEIQQADNLPDPYGSGRTRAEMGNIQMADVMISDEVKALPVPKHLVPDSSMHETTLVAMNRDYIAKVLPRDVVRMVSAVQNGGVVVRSHEVEHVTDIQGSYEVHTVNLRPVEGQPSSLKFRIPKFNPDGTYEAGGSQYFLRHQRYDAPIRKISPTIVQLASYYGKTQVSLSDKAVDSTDRWIINKLQTYALSEPGVMRDFVPGEAFDPEFHAPSLYSSIAGAFLSFKAQRNTYQFRHTDRPALAERLGVDLAKLETNGRVLCGYTPSKEPIVMTADNEFVVVGQGGESVLGDAFSVFQLDPTKAPLDVAQIRVGRQQIPIGMLLGYYFGFKSLLRVIGAKYRTIPTGKRTELGPHEYRIRFADTTYIFDRRDVRTSMIMSGYLKYERALKTYGENDMSKPGTFVSVLQSSGGVSAACIRDMDLMRTMFVDPITKNVLEAEGLPTAFPMLVLKACDMLSYRHHTLSQDTSAQRLRGAERVAGEIYTQLVKQIKAYRNGSRSGRIEMSPWAVWGSIASDQSGKITENINPIQYLKQQESVTYVGNGGRSKDSINKESRAFHKSDLGLISEAGVDSGDAGVNTFTSANPNITSLYGTIGRDLKMKPANLLSTSLALAPFGDRDDMLNMSY